jgi:hypothetical protein
VPRRLQTNALSGTIPRQLCGPTTRLRVLNMRSNRLTGSPAGVVNCTKLTQLDLSMNQFTGSAPATQVRLIQQLNRGASPSTLGATCARTCIDVFGRLSGMRARGRNSTGMHLLVPRTLRSAVRP